MGCQVTRALEWLVAFRPPLLYPHSGSLQFHFNVPSPPHPPYSPPVISPKLFHSLQVRAEIAQLHWDFALKDRTSRSKIDEPATNSLQFISQRSPFFSRHKDAIISPFCSGIQIFFSCEPAVLFRCFSFVWSRCTKAACKARFSKSVLIFRFQVINYLFSGSYDQLILNTCNTGYSSTAIMPVFM